MPPDSGAAAACWRVFSGRSMSASYRRSA